MSRLRHIVESVRLLRERGDGALNEVALHLGADGALAMLAMILEGTDEEKLAFLNAKKDAGFVDLDFGAGRGVVFNKTGAIYRIDVISKDKCEVSSVDGLLVSMYLGGGGPITTLFPGKYPYEEVQAILLRGYQVAQEEYLANLRGGSL
jgi:hypothetical protein